MDLMEPWDPLDHPPRIEIRRQDSDDSDAEGGLGNVTRVVLRPPGHSGKAKRGHLSFDASFETGNLGRVDFISEYEYDLFIRPDTCNPRFRIWFNFVVDNVRIDQRVIFNIVNLSKTKTLFSNGMTPLVKTTSRPKWQRLSGKYVYYHKSPEHRNHYILSFAFVFDREEDVYQFALTFPYSYSRVEGHFSLILQRNLPFLTVQTIALSLQNRKVRMLTICTPALMEKKPKVVVIMARSHPGESPTSYITQGLIDFLLSSHPMAMVLRDHVVIKVIPMVNPDGVFVGNYRTSLMGYDLNRNWNQISSWSHPVLNALKNTLLELDVNKTMGLDMILDLHSHTSLLGAFIYGNSYEDVYRFERHILFPKLLAHNAEDYNPTYTMYNRDPSKIGTARRHLCESLRSSVNVYTLEVSAYGYIQHVDGTTNTVPYSEDTYFRLGRNITRTLAEYYRVTGVIPASLLSPPTSSNQGNENEKKRIVRRSRSRSRPPTQEKPKSQEKEREGIQNVELNRQSIDDDNNESDVDKNHTSGDSDHGSIVSNHYSPRRGLKCFQSTISKGVEIDVDESIKINNGDIPFSKSVPASGSKKPTYHNFDFSILNSEECQKQSVTMNQGENNGVGTSGGRKVGGGGILGKQRTQQTTKNSMKLSPELASPSSPTSPPSLTIIDFNLLIRMGLERRLDPIDNGPLHRTKSGDTRDPTVRRNSVRRVRRLYRRHRDSVIRGVVPDSSPWEESLSDSSDYGEGTVQFQPRSDFPTPPLDACGIRNRKVSLNSRDLIKRPTNSHSISYCNRTKKFRLVRNLEIFNEMFDLDTLFEPI